MSLADTNVSTMTEAVVKPGAGEPPVAGVKEEKKEEVAAEVKAELQPNLKSWRILQQKERALVAERQKITQEKQQLMQEAAQLKSWRESQEAFERDKLEFKTNPDKLLERYGLKYQDVAEFQLNGKEPTPSLEVKAMRDQIKDLEERLNAKEAQKEAQEAERKKQTEEALIADFQDQINVFVASKPENYELININEAQHLVFQVVEDYYNTSGKLISIKEAADKVEGYLESQAEKLRASKKLQAKFSAQAPSRQEPKTQQTRTLSNEFTPTSAPQYGQTVKSETDRLNRALAALDGKK